jgi:hypothetical protein
MVPEEPESELANVVVPKLAVEMEMEMVEYKGLMGKLEVG